VLGGDDDMSHRVEWRKAPDFAEVAEALQLNTDQIMAAQVGGPGVTAVFTTGPGDDLDQTVYVARLARDSDGVLRPFGRPHATDLSLRKLIEQVEGSL
jgi:hypothetical protein